jgi:hypothetical protein
MACLSLSVAIREFMGLGAGKGYSTALMGLMEPEEAFKEAPASIAELTTKHAKSCQLLSLGELHGMSLSQIF